MPQKLLLYISARYSLRTCQASSFCQKRFATIPASLQTRNIKPIRFNLYPCGTLILMLFLLLRKSRLPLFDLPSAKASTSFSESSKLYTVGLSVRLLDVAVACHHLSNFSFTATNGFWLLYAFSLCLLESILLWTQIAKWYFNFKWRYLYFVTIAKVCCYFLI